jgi:hypothetical protein
MDDCGILIDDVSPAPKVRTPISLQKSTIDTHPSNEVGRFMLMGHQAPWGIS